MVDYDENEAENVANELEEVCVALEKEGITVEDVLKDFHLEIEDDLLNVTSVPAEELKAEEERRAQAELERVRHEAEIQRRRENILEERSKEARQELHEDALKKQQLLEQKKRLLILKTRLEHEKLGKAFNRAEAQLGKVIQERQAEVKTLYGDLLIANEQYGGARDRRWRVEWNRTPQPIQIKINCIRGVKDKIPVGKYAIMVSLYDRLGGHPMQWSKLESKRWGNATLPVAHTGKFFSSEMKIDQSVFTVAPAKTDLKPGMVLTYELFLLRGSQSPTDVSVAWGAFPICDANFDIISGHFKTVLLRGHMDSQIDRFERIEQLIASDLDHWLANIYFEIVRLPRYLAGQKEYEVELQFSSGLLNAPDRLKATEAKTFDGEDIPRVKDHDLDNLSSLTTQQLKNPKDLLEMNNSSRQVSRSATNLTESAKSGEEDKKEFVKAITIGSRQAASRYEKGVGDDFDSDSEGDWEEVEGEHGLYYKHHYMSPTLKYGEQVTALLPKNEQINAILEQSKPKKYNHLEELERHRFSVMNEFLKSTRSVIGVGRERATYCSRMFLSEVGLSQVRALEFWLFVLLFVILFFPRLYIHYVGQWILVNLAGFPPAKFVFHPHTVELAYQEDMLSTAMTVGVVMIGPLFNILVLSLLTLFAFLSIRLAGAFPSILSKSILIFGIWTCLDPTAILVIDCILRRFGSSDTFVQDDQPIGDAFKLYWHFFEMNGNGIVGIPITIFVYLVEMLLAFTILYVYFLKVHNNGRLLDTYHRLHGEDDDFLVPYDQEVSAKELTSICRKAEAWRGNEGETRKIIVNDFVWVEDDPDLNLDSAVRDSKKEVTVHLAIFTVHLDGLREIHRQFLRLPEGAILEIFGDISNAKLLPDVKASIMRKQANYEQEPEAEPEVEPEIEPEVEPDVASPVAKSRPPSAPKSKNSRPQSSKSQKPTAEIGEQNAAFVEDAAESNA